MSKKLLTTQYLELLANFSTYQFASASLAVNPISPAGLRNPLRETATRSLQGEPRSCLAISLAEAIAISSSRRKSSRLPRRETPKPEINRSGNNLNSKSLSMRPRIGITVTQHFNYVL